jgi:hypothetical protein
MGPLPDYFDGKFHFSDINPIADIELDVLASLDIQE